VGGPAASSSTLYVDATRFDVTSAEPEDADMRDTVAGYAGVLASKLDQVIGLTRVPLDSRFESIRTRETALGCFVTDIMRTSTGADIALLNSGTLRADALLPPGTLRLRDLVALLPMQDTTVTLRMRGARVLEALENSVRLWPAREGRFAQVSGVRFAFDPAAPPGSRVQLSSVRVLRRVDAPPAAQPPGVATAVAAGKAGGGASVDGGVGVVSPAGGSPARAADVRASGGAVGADTGANSGGGDGGSNSSGSGGSSSSATQLATALLSHVVIDEGGTPPDTPGADAANAAAPPPPLDSDTGGPPATPGVAVDPLVSPIRRLPDGMRHGYGTHCHEEAATEEAAAVEVGGEGDGATAGVSGGSVDSRTRAPCMGGSELTLDTGSGGGSSGRGGVFRGHGGGGHGLDDAADSSGDEDGHATAAGRPGRAALGPLHSPVALGRHGSDAGLGMGGISEATDESAAHGEEGGGENALLSPSQSALEAGLRIATLSPHSGMHHASGGPLSHEQHAAGVGGMGMGSRVASAAFLAYTVAAGGADGASASVPPPHLTHHPAAAAAAAAASLPSAAMAAPAPSRPLLPNPMAFAVNQDGAVVRRTGALPPGQGGKGGSPARRAPTGEADANDADEPAGGTAAPQVWVQLQLEELYTVATKACACKGMRARWQIAGGRWCESFACLLALPSLHAEPASTPPTSTPPPALRPADLSHGKDGYTCFSGPDVEVVVGEEAGPVLPTMLRNHFRILSALSGFGSMDLGHPMSPAHSPRMMPLADRLRRVPTLAASLVSAANAAAAQDGIGGAASAAETSPPPVAAHAAPDAFGGAGPHVVHHAPHAGHALLQPAGGHAGPHVAHAALRYTLAIAPVVDGRIRVIAAAAAAAATGTQGAGGA
jgi:hypothetical protein